MTSSYEIGGDDGLEAATAEKGLAHSHAEAGLVTTRSLELRVKLSHPSLAHNHIQM